MAYRKKVEVEMVIHSLEWNKNQVIDIRIPIRKDTNDVQTILEIRYSPKKGLTFPNNSDSEEMKNLYAEMLSEYWKPVIKSQ
jgi:hypothetical protein